MNTANRADGLENMNSGEHTQTLKKIKRFYFFLFSFIFVTSQLFLNIYAVNYIEKLLIKQRLEQNQQLVEMAFDTFKKAPLYANDYETIVPLLQDLASRKYFNRESFICAIDSNGYIIAHPDAKRVGLYRGDEQIKTASGFRPFVGETQLVEGTWDNRAFSSIEVVSTLYDENAKITIAAHQNKALVNEKLSVVRLYFTLFSVLILGVLFVIGWLLTRTVVGKCTNQIEQYENELEAFNYSVSHDLRAPLQIIDGFSYALLEDYADKLDDRGKDYLNRIRAASQRMGQLIDDMLRLSRVSRKEMIPEKVDLSAMAKTITEELHQKQPDREVTFAIAPEVEVNGDAQLLRIALENLLGNAWKYTGKHPRAKIEFGVTKHLDKEAYFVRDDGAGFDTDYAGKLFSPFQRLHGRNEFEGNGIGLAIVRGIIQRHGGRVWAEGAVEKGATFFFSLS